MAISHDFPWGIFREPLDFDDFGITKFETTPKGTLSRVNEGDCRLEHGKQLRTFHLSLNHQP